MRRTQVRRSDESNCSNAAVGEFFRRHQNSILGIYIFQVPSVFFQYVIHIFGLRKDVMVNSPPKPVGNPKGGYSFNKGALGKSATSISRRRRLWLGKKGI
jgi:hypothetical protein